MDTHVKSSGDGLVGISPSPFCSVY